MKVQLTSLDLWNALFLRRGAENRFMVCESNAAAVFSKSCQGDPMILPRI